MMMLWPQKGGMRKGGPRFVMEPDILISQRCCGFPSITVPGGGTGRSKPWPGA